MPVDTRIATLIFIVPFTRAVCIVAVESEVYSAFLVVSRDFAGPGDEPEGGSHDR